MLKAGLTSESLPSELSILVKCETLGYRVFILVVVETKQVFFLLILSANALQ